MDWRTCMQDYLKSLTAAGESHTLIQDHTTTLEKFFVQHDPASVSHEQVESFCKGESYHGLPSSQTIKRRKAAIRAYFDHAAKQGIFSGPNPARPPAREVKTLFADTNWEACYQSFLKDLKNKSGSESTVSSYKGVLTFFFTMHPDPNAVSRQDVSDYIYSPTNGKHRKGTTPAAATVNGRASSLRSFYNFASGYTTATPRGPEAIFQRANPTASIRSGKPNRAYKSLSLNEIKSFFDSMDPSDPLEARDRAVFWCYLLTCRRRSELAGLLWGQIQLGTVEDEDGTRRQAHTFSFYGKGHANQEDHQELPEKAYQEIQHYLELTGRWGHMQPKDPVFAATYPNQRTPRPGEQLRPLTTSTIAKRLKLHCRRAGISEAKFSMHSLRHSGAYLRKLAGEDLFSISRALRHSSLQTTQIYLEALQCSGDRGSQRISDHLARYGIQ
jgi:site-specific recombinase XerD